MKCKIHKTYKAEKPPRKTKNHPNGCEDCWKQYKTREALRELTRMTEEFGGYDKNK